MNPYAGKPQILSRLHRRSYDRFEMESSAIVSLDGKTEKPAVVRNISARGMRLVSNYPFRQGEKVTVILQAPYIQNPVQRNARVMWCKKADNDLWEMGVALSLKDTIRLS